MTKKKNKSSLKAQEQQPPCILMSLPSELEAEAAQTAIRINPENGPLAVHTPPPIMPTGQIGPFLAAMTSRLWGRSGIRLSVQFLDNPSASLKKKILSHMNAWSVSANVGFSETFTVGQVRIARSAGDSQRPGGYWSNLGTDILLVAPGLQTMNLEGFSDATPDSELIRVVRHETGHTLGWPHEHLRPEINRRIDRQKAIDYFKAQYGWLEKQTIEQVLTPLNRFDFYGSVAPDFNSIMAYPLPASIMKDGVAVPGGTDIDTLDRQFANTVYPPLPDLARQWGAAGDFCVPVDYDGDLRADLAVWRPSSGYWYILKSSTGYDGSRPIVQQWGASGDIPVPADYDGNHKAEIAVWRPSDGGWYILFSGHNPSGPASLTKQWGTWGDVPVPADFDGDGKADLAIWRPSDGGWYILSSSLGFDTNHAIIRQYGQAGDIPVPADFDGDGKADLAIYRPSEGGWYILSSATGTQTLRPFGTSGDLPVPFDYDGDGRADIAVWRPSEARLYILTSSSNFDPAFQVLRQFGSPGDQFRAIDIDGNRRQDLATWNPQNGNWLTQRVV
ncbi:MAG TPA: FG-GAP-like repeat-containing protein [Gemmatimonadales bacterium]|nr:FG-GAP-like repeat-containing protein [Gemmatimonadales bacterium]